MALANLNLNKRPSSSPVARLVRGDARTQIIRMNVPRYDGGIDLADFIWSVNFANADGKGDTIYIGVGVANEEFVTIDWVVSPLATAVEGDTIFELEGLYETDGESQVWQSGSRKIKVYADVDSNPEYDPQSLSAVQELIISVGIKVGGMTAQLEELIEQVDDAQKLVEDTKTEVENLDTTIKSAEIARNAAETARQTAEQNRTTAETERVVNEYARYDAETERVYAENTRISNETVRNTAESNRVTEETKRTTAEASRVIAENARQTAENARVQAMSTALQNVQTATENAETATNNADNATERANNVVEQFETVKQEILEEQTQQKQDLTELEGRVETLEEGGHVQPYDDTELRNLISRKADKTEIPEVTVKGTNQDWGATLSADGRIQIVQATTSNINNRNTVYKPITPNNLDLAVRAALVANAQITDADLPSIQSTLGIVTLTQEEYDLISSKSENTLYFIVG